jgi:hypothetical protein
LRRAWAELRASQPHLHGPEAAAQLGVPEAALLSSRIGHGSLEVSPDLSTLLAPAAEWSKLLVAGRSAFGVMLLVMGDVSVKARRGAVELRTATQSARLGAEGIARCYLFEEHDDHGHTVSLNWVDRNGDVIGRVFLLSKSARRIALPWIHARRAETQRSIWHCERMPPPTLQHDPRRSREPIARGDEAARLAARCLLAAGTLPGVRVELRSHGITLEYTGPLGKVWQTPPSIHASDLGCKLHLRLACARRVTLASDADDTECARIDAAEGSSLSLANPHARSGEPWVRRWIGLPEAA